MACLKRILQNDVESFLACLFHFGGINPIMLNNTLLMAIVTVCRHVLLCAEVHGRDYISRNPKAFSAHFVNVSYYALVVDLGFSYQVSGFTKKKFSSELVEEPKKRKKGHNSLYHGSISKACQ